MKTMKRLGCLLALVFAGASAFAEENGSVWFTATLPSDTTPAAPWTSIPTSWDAAAGSFNDWTTPLVYTPGTSVLVESEDATIITSVKFTAIDGTDVASGDLPDELKDATLNTGAKAGLTIVQTGDAAYQYYGLVPGGNPLWQPMGSVMETLPVNAVTVKVALLKVGEVNKVKYSVVDGATETLLGMYGANGATSFSSISYYGNCPQIASLAANKYSNLPEAKEEAEVVAIPGEVPETVSYSRSDLANRGIDVDNTAKVAEYLGSKQDNGQYGWVNTKLGLGDAKGNEIEARDTAQSTNEFVKVDFGVDVEKYEGVISYTVDDVESDFPGIEIVSSGKNIKAANTKVSEVKLYVKDDAGDDYEVGSALVGMMETGKAGPTSGTTFDIVAVPWDSMSGNAVTVNDLLNTAFLNNGDTLYIWNGSLYDTYVWTVPQEGDSYWAPSTQTVRDSKGTGATTSPNPATKTIAKNTAIWIERNVESRIVFAGTVSSKTDKFVATVAAGTASEATWSLIANPSIKTFNLNDIPVADHDALPEKQGVEVGDMIIVEDAADPREYTYENDAWGYMKKTGFVEKKGPRGTIRIPTIERCTDAVIPAGVGFWYVRAAKQPEFTITFGDNDVSNKE